MLAGPAKEVKELKEVFRQNFKGSGFPVFVERDSNRSLLLFKRAGHYDAFRIGKTELEKYQENKLIPGRYSNVIPGRPIWTSEEGILLVCEFDLGLFSGAVRQEIGLVPVGNQGDWDVIEDLKFHGNYSREFEILHSSFHPETIAHKYMVGKSADDAYDREQWTRVGDSELLLYTGKTDVSKRDKLIKAFEEWEQADNQFKDFDTFYVDVSSLSGRALAVWWLDSTCTMPGGDEVFVTSIARSISQGSKAVLFKTSFSPEEGFSAFNEIGEGGWSLNAIRGETSPVLLLLRHTSESLQAALFGEHYFPGTPTIMRKTQNGIWEKRNITGLPGDCTLLAASPNTKEDTPFLLTAHRSKNESAVFLHRLDLATGRILPGSLKIWRKPFRFVQSIALMAFEGAVSIGIHTVDNQPRSVFAEPAPPNDETLVLFLNCGTTGDRQNL
ncbi:hypothetical protein ACFL4W_03110 [Planctomycetota bacterium]